MQAEMISNIRFTTISPEMIKKMSVAKIIVPDTCNDEGYPIDGGLLDQRLGVIDPGLKCKTCGGRVKSCPGHFGHIELVRYTIHPEFAKAIYLLLDATCESCHRILLNQKQIDDIRPEIVEFVNAEDVLPDVSQMQPSSVQSAAQQPSTIQAAPEQQSKQSTDSRDKMAIIKKLKNVKKCPYCGTEQHKLKFERPTFFYMNGNKMKPDEIRDWLTKISNEDLALIGIDGTVTRPEWFIITDLLVPPVNIRPSITLESGERSEDDLTHKLLDIIRTNQRLEQDIDAGAPQIIIDDLWELLQYQVTTYFNNETPGVPVARHRSTRPLKTLAQRLKGKEGRLRYYLSGKRVNFSARTVVSPDNNISINEIGMPQKIAENLTIPLYVTKWNIETARGFMKRAEYPTITNYISKDGMKKRMSEINREELAAAIQPGDILERQLVDGDYVLFNRQPTLHRASIMAHRVRVLPGKTFRLHVCASEPYNADFDGDEMNVHVPQTIEAQAEARYLVDAEQQILSAKDGSPVIHATEDIITGVYMLTNDEAFFTKESATKLLSSVGITDLPKPNKSGMYKGTDIFSKIIPEEITIESKSGSNVLEIKNGKIIKGYVDKSAISGKGSLILEIFSTSGPRAARLFIDNMTKLAMVSTYMCGVTISLRDYYMPESVDKSRNDIISETVKNVNDIYTKYKEKKLELLPGYSRKKTYEVETFAMLDIAREKAERLLQKSISVDNNAMRMAVIGARGNIFSFVQTSMLLGQQAVSGSRPARGYTGRVLPYFPRNDKDPKSRGFIESGFVEGLDFIDYYMHAMGARYSSMNKSLTTAVSGYLYRRLSNAMQDFYVGDDGSVRDASNALVQTIYGGDGIDPIKEKMSKKK